MAVSQFPRLAAPADIGRLVTGDRVHHQWPPPGTTVLPIAGPEPWVVVTGEPTSGEDGDWWVTTLAQIALDTNATVLQLLARFGATFTGPIAVFAGTVGNWPVIYTQGEGDFMRWIASTFRGTIGGVEEFQFGLNWGNPGADPDPNEAETLAFANALATKFGALWVTSIGGQLPKMQFMPEVVFTEVGAVVKTQSSATNADGTGGDLEQKFDTQWSAYAVGARPTGGATTGVSLPYETSCAVTLQTDKRGASGRGRIYLPPFTTSAMAALGKYDSTIPSRMGGFIGALAAGIEADTSHELIVVSRRRIQLNKVTTINVGLVPDSQRRRRRSQDEARVLAWTAP